MSKHLILCRYILNTHRRLQTRSMSIERYNYISNQTKRPKSKSFNRSFKLTPGQATVPTYKRCDDRSTF